MTLPQGQLSYAYDPATGNLSTLTDPFGGTLTYAYDGSLLTNTTWGGEITGSLGRIYDNDFPLASLSFNGNPMVRFPYDADGLLTGAGALAVNRSPLHGLITGTTLGSVTDTRDYNGFGEWTGYRAAFNATELFAAQYVRDQLGRIL